MLVFLIDENMTAKEIKKEIDDILKPIKLFCKRWNVQIHTEGKNIMIDEVTAKIRELMMMLRQQGDEKLQVRIDNFHRLELALDLFSRSLNHLNELEIELIYHVLLSDRTQAELSEDEQLWLKFGIANISTTKVNTLYQEACLNLLELIKYNQIKQGSQ